MAEELAERLLPAFNTPTGIPYGTVNLVSGVPKSETPIASLAGAGSMSVEVRSGEEMRICPSPERSLRRAEPCFNPSNRIVSQFEALSRLTGRGEFGNAARKAVKALWRRRSASNLLGKHIDIVTGRWTETVSGLGSNSDSFYEYLFKYWVLFGDDDFLTMFHVCWLGAASEEMRAGPWYAEVDMHRGGKGGKRTR